MYPQEDATSSATPLSTPTHTRAIDPSALYCKHCGGAGRFAVVEGIDIYTEPCDHCGGSGLYLDPSVEITPELALALVEADGDVWDGDGLMYVGPGDDSDGGYGCNWSGLDFSDVQPEFTADDIPFD